MPHPPGRACCQQPHTQTLGCCIIRGVEEPPDRWHPTMAWSVTQQPAKRIRAGCQPDGVPGTVPGCTGSQMHRTHTPAKDMGAAHLAATRPLAGPGHSLRPRAGRACPVNCASPGRTHASPPAMRQVTPTPRSHTPHYILIHGRPRPCSRPFVRRAAHAEGGSTMLVVQDAWNQSTSARESSSDSFFVARMAQGNLKSGPNQSRSQFDHWNGSSGGAI